MKLSKSQGSGIIVLSLLGALVLTMLPFPEWARLLRPEWVSLVVIYWALALPHRVGLGVAWSMGILLDIIKDTLLGQHALALVLVVYLVLYLHQRLRLFPLLQQSLVIFVLLFLQTMVVFWIKGISGQVPAFWYSLLPALTSALLWSPVFLFLRRLRRLHKVS